MGRIGPVPFPENLAQAVVVKCAKRAILRFGAFHDLDVDDLIQEGLIFARRGWENFDPTRGVAPSTYIYRCAWNAMNIMHRVRARRGNHEREFVERTGLRGERDEIPAPAEDADELVEFAEQTYQRSCAYLEARGIDGLATARPGFARTFSLAQALTVLAIKGRLRLSSRATRHVLAEREDLCRVIELSRVPHHSMMTRFFRSAARIEGSHRRRRNRAASAVVC